MLNSIPKVPQPHNEPVLGYAPGSAEKKAVKRALETMAKAPTEIPLVIGGVTVGEFWRLVLVLLNTLFFSLTAGLVVSASSRDERRAWSGTTGLVLLFAVLPITVFC